MKDSDELFEWLYDLYLINLNIQISLSILLRVRKPANKYERKILYNGFFIQVSNNARVDTAIHLCTIFQNNRNQKRNIYKLFDQLSTTDYLQTFSSKSEILSTIELLRVEIETHRELIDELIDRRNKLYAHLDPDSNLPFMEDDKLEVLAKLAIKTFNELCLKILGDTYNLKNRRTCEADPVIKALVRDYKNRNPADISIKRKATYLK